MDSIERIHERAKNKVSASQVALMDEHIQLLKQQKTEVDKEKDVLFSAAIGILIERARETRKAAQDSFWEKFDNLISCGDTVEWYSGWGMERGMFEYHTDWHVYVNVNGQRSGLPIIIDSEWEKI